jgi:hypothetical protein
MLTAAGTAHQALRNFDLVPPAVIADFLAFGVRVIAII